MTTVDLLQRLFNAFKQMCTERLKRYNVDERRIHLLLIAGIATGMMMFVYTGIAYFYLSSSLVLWIGIISSTAHIIGPVFLTTRLSFKAATNLYLTCGLVFQLSYSYFNGGQASESFVWLGMHPILAGMLLGARAAVGWAIIALGCAGAFLIAVLAQYPFPVLLKPEGVFISDVFTSFGWIIMLTILVSHFLSAQKKNEQLLRRKSDKINNLLRILTHDVSNSLNVLNSASDLSKLLGEDDGQNQFLLEKMEMASGSINEVINNVRTLHNCENGWESIECVPYSLSNSLQFCFKLLEDKTKSKGVFFRFSNDHDEKCVAMIDPLYFNHHVLMNVLTNAIKFSEPNSPIDICAKNIGAEVILSIRDYGVGISKSDLSGIFDPKENKSTSGTAGEKGSGFGLMIMQSFMARFDGNVVINSKEKGIYKDHGTEVILNLKPALARDLQSDNFRFSNFVMKSIQSKDPYNVACSKENSGQGLANNFS